jgi:hypothetical protein
MTTIRIVRPVLIVVILACTMFSWTLFTAWGVLAAYVGSQAGGMASQSELDAARTKATWSFASLVILQLMMLGSGAFLARSLTKNARSVFWPSLKNWLIALLLTAGVDGVVLTTMLYRQARG